MRGIRVTASCAGIVAWSTFFLIPSFVAQSFAQVSLEQTNFALNAILEQLPTRGEDPVYDFWVRANPFFSPGAVVESLIAPDGTAGVSSFFPNSHAVHGENVPLSTVQSVFSGTWTFTERRGDELLEYEFTLPEITPVVFPETPTILSPMDGDTVGTEFLLDWEYESGTEPSGLSIQGKIGEGIQRFNRETIDPTSLNILLDVDPGFSEGDLTLRIGNSDSRDLNIIPVSPGADATFVLDFIQIESLSLPVTITARIPEPTAFILLGLATPLLRTERRMRCRQ